MSSIRDHQNLHCGNSNMATVISSVGIWLGWEKLNVELLDMLSSIAIHIPLLNRNYLSRELPQSQSSKCKTQQKPGLLISRAISTRCMVDCGIAGGMLTDSKKGVYSCLNQGFGLNQWLTHGKKENSIVYAWLARDSREVGLYPDFQLTDH